MSKPHYYSENVKSNKTVKTLEGILLVCYQKCPFGKRRSLDVQVEVLTFRSGLSLIRNLFLLKLSLRTLDQLKALILV